MPLPQSPKGCSIDSFLRLLSGPWTTYILWILRSNGPTRFGELKRQVGGISAKVLTERLRVLETGGVIFRRCEPTTPQQVIYGLTERGKQMKTLLDQMSKLALRWSVEDGQNVTEVSRAPFNSLSDKS